MHTLQREATCQSLLQAGLPIPDTLCMPLPMLGAAAQLLQALTACGSDRHVTAL
jgi:hypothetical protein